MSRVSTTSLLTRNNYRLLGSYSFGWPALCEAPHGIAVLQRHWMAAKRMEVQSPSPPRGAFFRVGSWSIDGDTGSGRRSFDLLYGGSDADLIKEGRPEFDIEVTLVGFAVGGDRIRFVDGEDV